MLLDFISVVGADGSAPTTEVIITKVHDGDTPSDSAGSIRMLGMDAPELKQEPWGKQARAWLTERIIGRTVLLLKDTHAPDRDKYGRLLRWIKTDQILNIEIVRAGLAVKYILGKLDYRIEIETAETEAKSASLLIWSDPSFILPANFRKHIHDDYPSKH